MPDKDKPAWSRRLESRHVLIGLIAFIAATLIVMSPEFYALGLLGDSTFFDLLVLAISLQLQTVLARLWSRAVAGAAPIKQFATLRLCTTYAMVLLLLAGPASLIQKIAHRLSS